MIRDKSPRIGPEAGLVWTDGQEGGFVFTSNTHGAGDVRLVGCGECKDTAKINKAIRERLSLAHTS